MNSSPHRQCSGGEDERPVAGGVGSDSTSISSNNGRTNTHQYIEMVQNLIERCLQLYMTKDEAVNTLWDQAKIEPGITSTIWQMLEQQNVEFFKAYKVRLALKEQIDQFNWLLLCQSQLMQDFPSNQNGAAQVPEPYIFQQQFGIPSTFHPQMHQPSSLSDCQVPNGLPASGCFHQFHPNADRETIMDDALPTTIAHPFTQSLESEVAVGPVVSATPNGQFSPDAVYTNGFSKLDCSSYAPHMDTMPHHLEGIGSDYCEMLPLHSFPHIPYNLLSFPDFRVHGQMGNYTGSFILQDSAEEEKRHG